MLNLFDNMMMVLFFKFINHAVFILLIFQLNTVKY